MLPESPPPGESRPESKLRIRRGLDSPHGREAGAADVRPLSDRETRRRSTSEHCGPTRSANTHIHPHPSAVAGPGHLRRELRRLEWALGQVLKTATGDFGIACVGKHDQHFAKSLDGQLGFPLPQPRFGQGELQFPEAID